nr:two-component regulator propeller domain-containing protein [Pontibacter harenae]
MLLITSYTSAQQHNFRNWSLEDGLPQSQVNHIIQDRIGQLWLATRGGVSKFDGTSFETYTKQQGLSSNNIRQLFLDSKNRLWVGTYNHGLDLITGGKSIVSYGSKEGIAEGAGVYKIDEDQAGRILVATDSGVYYLAKNMFVRASQFPKQVYTSLSCAKTGAIWAGSASKGLYSVQNNQTKHYTTQNSPLPSNNVTTITQGKSGKIWIGTSNGVATYVDQKLNLFALTQNLNQAHVTSIVQDGYNSTWISLRNNGLIRYSKGHFTHLTRSNGLLTNQVLSLLPDKEGNLWIGTGGYGLQQHSNPSFVHYTALGNHTTSKVTALTCDAAGDIWLGTDNGFVARTEGDILKWTAPAKWPEETIIHNIMVRSEDDVWLNTNNGVWHILNKKISKHYVTADGLPSAEVYYSLTDRENNIWFATANGVAIFDNENFKTVPATAAVGAAYEVLQDSDNIIWVGSQTGIFRYESDTLTKVKAAEEHDFNEIVSIEEDKLGNLYFGGFNHGLLVYDKRKNKYTKIAAADGLRDEGVRSLLYDASNNLWIGTGRSLLKLNLAPFQQEGSIKFTTYGRKDGFKGLEVSQNSIAQTPDGSIWIGTARGVTKHVPELERQNKALPKLILTDIRLFMRETDWEEHGQRVDTTTGLPKDLKLPYNQNHLTLDFYGLTLTNPEEVTYRYRLEGLEEEWSEATEQSYVTYAGLAPGTYTFHLMASNSDGIWSPKPLTYNFSIMPPFWRREWFVVMVLLLVTGAVIGIVRLREQSLIKMNNLLEMRVQHRTEQLEKKNYEKEILLKEIHHRVKNNLQIIISMLNLQARSVKDVVALDMMRTIRSRVRSMALLHEHLYQHVDLSSIDLDDYFRGICESLYASYGISTKQVSLELDVPHMKVDIDSAITLGLIVNELVSNALKYAFQDRPGKLQIVLDKHDNQHCTLTVSDNGRGLPPDFFLREKKSFGLQLVSSLSKKINGSINHESNGGTKSTLFFVLPSEY